MELNYAQGSGCDTNKMVAKYFEGNITCEWLRRIGLLSSYTPTDAVVRFAIHSVIDVLPWRRIRLNFSWCAKLKCVLLWRHIDCVPDINIYVWMCDCVLFFSVFFFIHHVLCTIVQCTLYAVYKLKDTFYTTKLSSFFLYFSRSLNVRHANECLSFYVVNMSGVSFVLLPQHGFLYFGTNLLLVYVLSNILYAFE